MGQIFANNNSPIGPMLPVFETLRRLDARPGQASPDQISPTECAAGESSGTDSAPRPVTGTGRAEDGEGPAPADAEALATPLHGRRGAEDRQDVQRGGDDDEGQQ